MLPCLKFISSLNNFIIESLKELVPQMRIPGFLANILAKLKFKPGLLTGS